MRWWALTLGLCAACAGQSAPPRGPDYQPQATPEPPTACPAEAAAAKQAREAAIGEETPALAAGAAAAVFRLAECERRVFDGLPLESADDAGGLAAARAQYNTAQNLYREAVVTTAGPRWGIAGEVRAADLTVAWAARLRGLPPPAGTGEPREQALWQEEVGKLAQTLVDEADRGYERALLLGRTLPGATDDADARGLLRHACDALAAQGRRPGACL